MGLQFRRLVAVGLSTAFMAEIGAAETSHPKVSETLTRQELLEIIHRSIDINEGLQVCDGVDMTRAQKYAITSFQEMPSLRQIWREAEEANGSGRYDVAVDRYKVLLGQFTMRQDIFGTIAMWDVLAGTLLDQNRYAEAEEYARKYLGCAIATGDRKQTAYAFANLAHVHSGKGEPREAARLFSVALQYAEGLGDISIIGAIHQRKARHHQRYMEWEAALTHFQLAGQIHDKLGREREKAIVLSEIGGVHWLSDKPEVALDYFRKAEPVFRRLNDKQLLGMELFFIGQVQAAQRHLPEALRSLTEARDILRSVEDKTWLPKVLWELSEHVREQEALSYLEEAAEIWHQAGVRDGEAVVSLDIAKIHASRGDYQSAVNELRKALIIVDEESRNEISIIVLTELGAMYDQLGDRHSAQRYYKEGLVRAVELGENKVAVTQALRLAAWSKDAHEATEYIHLALSSAKKSQDPGLIVLSYLQAGSISYATGDMRSAMHYAEEALKLAKDESRESVPSCLRVMGHLLQLQGDMDGSKKYYTESLTLSTTSGHEDEIVADVTALGDLAFVRRDYSLAHEYFRNALGYLETTSVAKIGLLWRLARTLAAGGKDEDAKRAYANCLEAIEHYAVWLQEEELAARFIAAHDGIYNDFIALLLLTGGGYEAWLVHERQRAFSTYKAGGVPDMEALRVPDVAGLYASIAELQHGAAGGRPASAVFLGDKDELYFRIAKRLEAVSYLKSSQETKPRSRSATFPVIRSIQEIQQQILRDGKSAIVQYRLIGDALAVWVITKDGFRAKVIPDANGVRTTARVYYLMLSDPRIGREPTRLGSVGHSLYTSLLEPIHEALTSVDTIVVIPEGELSYLPFETLVMEDVSQHHVGVGELPFALRRWRFTYATSGRELFEVMRSDTSGKRKVTLAAFGGIAYQEIPRAENSDASNIAAAGQSVRGIFEIAGVPLSPLPNSLQEVRSIGKYFGEKRARLFVGSDASEGNVKSSKEVSQAAYLHFATHGLVDERLPKLSGLALYAGDATKDDGFLQLYEIEDLKLNADLITLSACSTALGEHIAGYGIRGLTRGFIHAGASSVVASLWNVEDESTALLMESFYKDLLRGRSDKASALRSSKLELMEDDRYGAPYFWGGFVLFGDWN